MKKTALLIMIVIVIILTAACANPDKDTASATKATDNTTLEWTTTNTKNIQGSKYITVIHYN